MSICHPNSRYSLNSRFFDLHFLLAIPNEQLCSPTYNMLSILHIMANRLYNVVYIVYEKRFTTEAKTEGNSYLSFMNYTKELFRLKLQHNNYTDSLNPDGFSSP